MPDTTVLGLMEFIDACPTPFHVAQRVATRLSAAGFVELRETEPWDGVGRSASGCYVVRGGSLVAWRGSSLQEGFRIIGAHTDSPNLRLKPRPDSGQAGVRQLAVEVYGGVLLNSWLDRDLGVAGRLVTRDTEHLFHVERPLLRVPQLAIHLDREVNTAGLRLNPQTHLSPIWGLGAPREGEFVAMAAESAGVDPTEVLAWDAMLHDTAPSALGGRDEEFLWAPRIDNQLSCFGGLQALLGSDPDGPTTAVLCLFDHEEVGSVTARGAASSMLATLLERIAGSREALHMALARSLCVSADGAHATHPNYADRHEPGHHVALNGGPVIKRNANERYATDATGQAAFMQACERASVPWQLFVNRSDLACGSTIGPPTAALLGVTTVDAGVAQLSMHSVREACGSQDPAAFTAALGKFLAA